MRILGDWQPREYFDCKYGANGWRATPRFAVWQTSAEKWRVIDNGLASQTNLLADLMERIHTTSLEMGFTIVRAVLVAYEKQGIRAPGFARGTRDMKRAYRQVLRWAGHAHLHIICIWHPLKRCWVFAELRGLAFGLVVAVNHFNRVPAQLVATARRWLGIPAIN